MIFFLIFSFFLFEILKIEDFHLFMLSIINNKNDDEDLDSIIFMQHLCMKKTLREF